MKSKRNFKYIFFQLLSYSWIILFFLSLLSCNKYLEAKPDKKLVLPSDLENLQALLDNSTIMNERDASINEACTDNYWELPTTLQAASTRLIDIYEWQYQESDFTSYPDDWSSLYDAVYYANVVLDNINSVIRTNENAEEWNNVKGEALFYRAYSFLETALIYAPTYDSMTAAEDKGIVLRLTSDFNIPSQRSSLLQSYLQIKQDIAQAIELLSPQIKSPMRPSKEAAYALMARMYLSVGNYKEVELYSDSCLQLYHELMDYNDVLNSSFQLPFKQFNEEVIFQKRAVIFSTIYSPTNALIDTLLYTKYSTYDLRKTLFFTHLADNQYRFRGSYDGYSNSLFTGIATDEVLLMRAEASARLGKTENALADLDSLMIKRTKKNEFIPFSAMATADVIKVILEERRKELIFRSLRWMDLKRINKDTPQITLLRNINGEIFTLPPNDKRYALPIPQTVIQQSGIEQNKY